MVQFRFSPPAGQRDLAGQPSEATFLDSWSALIARQFQAEIKGLKQLLGQEPLFFSQADRSISGNAAPTPVPWVGFPRILTVRANGGRRAALDAAEIRGTDQIGYSDRAMAKPVSIKYRQQDEYLEWVAVPQGAKPARFIFTAEGPEYWEHLASVDRNAVLRLYHDLTGRDVAWSELSWASDVWVSDGNGSPVQIYARGDYNPHNKVNLDECAAHLTHPANTLGAEIDLAAKATVQRTDAHGELLGERRRLACCSNFGDQNRNSDPTIGLAVNQTVRGGVSLTLADPVGLYIRAFDASRVSDTAGNVLDGWWTIKRGSPGRTLRAEFGPPAGSNLSIQDVRIGNNEVLSSGGQLAELITMVLYARAANFGVAEPSSQPCLNRCCVKQGASPDTAELVQIARDDADPAGTVNAFPELAADPMNPFTRRRVGRRRTRSA